MTYMEFFGFLFSKVGEVLNLSFQIDQYTIKLWYPLAFAMLLVPAWNLATTGLLGTVANSDEVVDYKSKLKTNQYNRLEAKRNGMTTKDYLAYKQHMETLKLSKKE